MGLPNIIINFKTAGITAIKRGQRGIVAIILKDSASNGVTVLNSINDIPAGLSQANKEHITRAFVGGISVPKKVLIYVIPVADADYTNAYTYLETVKFDYLVCPPDVSGALATATATWVKTQRDSLDKKIKAVLPSTTSDHEGIINFDTNNIKVGAVTFTAAQYCSRIAGILAGTPLTVSATFTVLSEVTDVPRLTKTQADTAIDAGKLVLYHDGEKVKIARAVNSLVTTSTDKGASFKKIKIVDILDLVHSDIKKTSNDSYVGKVANSYDNKCLLITAIKGYYDQLEIDGLLDKGKSSIGIDIIAQTSYLTSAGVDVSDLSEYDIKSANTADKVFLASSIKPLDAIEDITLNVTI
jgi:hypothetical protein